MRHLITIFVGVLLAVVVYTSLGAVVVKLNQSPSPKPTATPGVQKSFSPAVSQSPPLAWKTPSIRLKKELYFLGGLTIVIIGFGVLIRINKKDS